MGGSRHLESLVLAMLMFPVEVSCVALPCPALLPASERALLAGNMWLFAHSSGRAFTWSLIGLSL